MSVRSEAPGDDHDGGRQRSFKVVPEGSLERVRRDVTATFPDVPLWGVAELFQRVHTEMGRPDVGEITATLTVEYQGLSEADYKKLASLRDKFWMEIELDVTKTRLYPSRDSGTDSE